MYLNIKKKIDYHDVISNIRDCRQTGEFWTHLGHFLSKNTKISHSWHLNFFSSKGNGKMQLD